MLGISGIVLRRVDDIRLPLNVVASGTGSVPLKTGRSMEATISVQPDEAAAVKIIPTETVAISVMLATAATTTLLSDCIPREAKLEWTEAVVTEARVVIIASTCTEAVVPDMVRDTISSVISGPTSFAITALTAPWKASAIDDDATRLS
jgi:hypothetical protein